MTLSNSSQTTISTTTKKIINELNLNHQLQQTVPSSPPCSSTTSSIQNPHSDSLPFNHHQIMNSSILSNHQGSRTFSNKHHAQIMEILANIPTQSASEERNSNKEKPLTNPVSGIEDSFHPTLRSTQSTQVSSPPSTSRHLNPNLFSSTSQEDPLTMNSIISTTTGYHSSSSKSLEHQAQRLPWSSSHGPCSNEREEPIAGSSNTNWNPPRSRSSSPHNQELQPDTNLLHSIDITTEDHINLKIDKRLAEASTLVWNDNGTGNDGSDVCTSRNGNGESVDRNSDQWKQNRKNNHKEVERRRRETINEGITELKKIIPGTEKNKGEILKQAVKYIQQLKETEIKNEEKWAIEKLLLEESIQEQSNKFETLSRDYLNLEAENESLKRWIIELGEKSQPIPSIRVLEEEEEEEEHDHERVPSRTSSSEPTRHDQQRTSSSNKNNQAIYIHNSHNQDTESNIHHLLRTETEEFGVKRSNDHDEPNSSKKSKLK